MTSSLATKRAVQIGRVRLRARFREVFSGEVLIEVADSHQRFLSSCAAS
jgi:hypothetical protein